MKYIFCLILNFVINNAIAHGHDHYLYAKATLYDLEGQPVGKVKFTQQKDDVVVDVHVVKLPAGFHGFHVHAVGECNPPFASALGHFDLDRNTHRNHNGDMPVLLVNNDGTAKMKFMTDRFTVEDLLDNDGHGSAVIIHDNPDNYANIPNRYSPARDGPTLATGDAGARIACGIVK